MPDKNNPRRGQELNPGRKQQGSRSLQEKENQQQVSSGRRKSNDLKEPQQQTPAREGHKSDVARQE